MVALMPPDLLSATDAALRFTANGIPVTRRTVHRWAKTGRIPSVELPSGRLLIPADAIDEYAAPVPASDSETGDAA